MEETLEGPSCYRTNELLWWQKDFPSHSHSRLLVRALHVMYINACCLPQQTVWGEPHGFPWQWAGGELNWHIIHTKDVALSGWHFQKGVNLTHSWTVLHFMHTSYGHETGVAIYTSKHDLCILSSWIVWASLVIVNIFSFAHFLHSWRTQSLYELWWNLPTCMQHIQDSREVSAGHRWSTHSCG